MKKILISASIALLITGIVYWKNHNTPVFGANQKISELTNYATPTGSDVLPINDVANATTKQITLSNLFTVLSATYPVQKIGNIFSLAFGTTSNNNWSGQNIFQNSSTTVVGGLNIGGNATATNATTTAFFTTTASSTSLFGAGLPLAGCTGSNVLQWALGKFNCAATTGGISTFSTTTTQNMATTTIRLSEIPSGNRLRVTFYAPNLVGSATTSGPSLSVNVAFNANTDPVPGINYVVSKLAGASSQTAIGGTALVTTGPTGGFLSVPQPTVQHGFTFEINNSTAIPKIGQYAYNFYGTSTGGRVDQVTQGIFEWGTTTTAIRQIDIYTGASADQAAFATGTVITIEGY